MLRDLFFSTQKNTYTVKIVEIHAVNQIQPNTGNK